MKPDCGCHLTDDTVHLVMMPGMRSLAGFTPVWPVQRASQRAAAAAVPALILGSYSSGQARCASLGRYQHRRGRN